MQNKHKGSNNEPPRSPASPLRAARIPSKQNPKRPVRRALRARAGARSHSDRFGATVLNAARQHNGAQLVPRAARAGLKNHCASFADRRSPPIGSAAPHRYTLGQACTPPPPAHVINSRAPGHEARRAGVRRPILPTATCTPQPTSHVINSRARPGQGKTCRRDVRPLPNADRRHRHHRRCGPDARRARRASATM